jgi:uncharacterized protein
VGVLRFLSLLLLLALATGPLSAQPPLPASTSLVVDDANVISADKEQLLRDAVLGFYQTQHRRVAVVTLPELQGYDIAYVGQLIGRRYGLGTRDDDDGAVLIVAPHEMKVRIEVGSGIAPILPREVADQIVETWVLPSFRQGDIDKGILDGTGAIFSYLERTPEEAAAIAEQARLEQAQAHEDEGFPWAALVALIAFVLLWPIVRAILGGTFGMLGTIVLLGGSGGIGRGGFGGFGGGGGGFNGGGASGRW